VSKIYICHAGADMSTEEGLSEPLGIIGMAYYWSGEWIRSPEEVEGITNDRNPVMKLKPVFGPDIEVYGDMGCFSSIKECEFHIETNA